MSKIFTRAEINKKTAKSIARFYAVQTTLIARKVEVLTLQLKLALLLLYSSINSKNWVQNISRKALKLTVTSTTWISSSSMLTAQCKVICHVTFKIGASQRLPLVGWFFSPITPSAFFGVTSISLVSTRLEHFPIRFIRSNQIPVAHEQSNGNFQGFCWLHKAVLSFLQFMFKFFVKTGGVPIFMRFISVNK